jgi:surface carbohydrate biosynthesis protein
LMDYFVRYLNDNGDKNYKIAVALRPQDKSLTKGEYEENYFREYLKGFDYDIIQNKPMEFSTYQAMDESEVIINHYSTSCFEALSWDKKILFCQFYDYPKFPLPEDLFWKVTEPNYKKFKEQLDHLIKMNQKDYIESISSNKKKYCKMDIDNPAHEIIKGIINSTR